MEDLVADSISVGECVERIGNWSLFDCFEVLCLCKYVQDADILLGCYCRDPKNDESHLSFQTFALSASDSFLLKPGLLRESFFLILPSLDEGPGWYRCRTSRCI